MNKRRFILRNMTRCLLGVLLFAVVVCVTIIQAEEESTPTTTEGPDTENADIVKDTEANSEQLQADEFEARVQQKAAPAASDNYGEFAGESIKLSLNACKFPGDEVRGECGETVDKLHGDPYCTHHPDNCKEYEEPYPAYYRPEPPFCPPFGPQTMPWNCYSYPYTHRSYPFYQPNYYRYDPRYNFSRSSSNSCSGYGFGPHLPSPYGPTEINRCFLENALKDHKSFEQALNQNEN